MLLFAQPTAHLHPCARPPALPRSWIEELSSTPGVVRAIDAAMLLEENHPVLEDDHM